MTDQQKYNLSSIDTQDEITKIDTKNVLGSILALPDQIELAWEETKSLDLKLNSKINNITVAGMGGSGLGADVIRHLYKKELAYPLNLINDYDLPAYVDENSLVILSSYSGNTEEILHCAQEALTKKAQIIVITGGGKLADFAKEYDLPVYIIPQENNPSNQPRMAIGYTVIGLIGMFAKLDLLKISDDEIEQTIKAVETQITNCGVNTPSDENPAKTLCFTLVDRRPNIVAAEFLTGAAHVVANQFNENAKTFANYYQVPEINHHLLEALKLPKSNSLDNIFLFLNSHLYRAANQKRMVLTQQAVEKQNFEGLSIELKSDNRLTQVFELITLMAFTNFYLAILNQIDPSQIPMVDWFKQELKK